MLLNDCKLQLSKAARSFGVIDSWEPQNTFYSLITCWIPPNMQKVVDAFIALLPLSARQWGYEVSSTLLTKTSIQMLFSQHVAAIRGS